MRPPTRRLARLVLAAVVAAAGPLLSACDSLDTIEIFDSKKKLAGERKPVFPEGVPGVALGVPPELIKGYREPEGGALDPAKAAAEAAAEPAAKPKKPKAAPQRTATKPAPKPQASPDPYAGAPTRAATPQPAQQPAAQPAAAPWPAVQPQAAWPASPGAVAR